MLILNYQMGLTAETILWSLMAPFVFTLIILAAVRDCKVIAAYSSYEQRLKAGEMVVSIIKIRSLLRVNNDTIIAKKIIYSLISRQRCVQQIMFFYWNRCEFLKPARNPLDMSRFPPFFMHILSNSIIIPCWTIYILPEQCWFGIFEAYVILICTYAQIWHKQRFRIHISLYKMIIKYKYNWFI